MQLNPQGRRTVAVILALMLSVVSSAALAVPKRIIILRHGEKQNDYSLCLIGQQRALALRANYLGKDAAKTLFPDGRGPDGFFSITLHTLELASPATQTWPLPMQLYSVVPMPNLDKRATTVELNRRTQEAAHEVLTSPRWDGKTVVMVWEHDHIAKPNLEKQFPNEKVTLRQLLNLDSMANTIAVPADWPGSNYDYFWIVDYGNAGSATPTNFKMMKQDFPAPFTAVPSNGWNKPEKLPPNSGCQS